MTNAELEVIEVAFTYPVKQTIRQSPGISSIILPINPNFKRDIASRYRRPLYPQC